MVRTKANGRHYVEFQLRGKRVHRVCPKGATLADAEVRARRMRQAIINGADVDEAFDGPPLINSPRYVRDDWLRVASILLRVVGIQPRPGVYLLSKGGELIYIGQSRNVAYRIGDHFPKEYDHAVMVEADDDDLRQLEHFLIKMLRPRMNVLQRRPAGGFLVGSAEAPCLPVGAGDANQKRPETTENEAIT